MNQYITIKRKWICKCCGVEHTPKTMAVVDEVDEFTFCDEECWHIFYKDKIENYWTDVREREEASRGQY